MPSFQTPSPHNDNPWDWDDANIEAEDIRTRNRRATMAVGAAVVVGSLGAVVMFSGINGVTPSSVVSEMSEVVSEMSGAVYGHDRRYVVAHTYLSWQTYPLSLDLAFACPAVRKAQVVRD